MKNIEASSSSYLFVYRLNEANGTFPLFKERFKRKLGGTATMSLAEAGAQAKKLVIDIQHLQTTGHRDNLNLPNSSKDLQRAANTWLWMIDWNGDEYKASKDRRTEDSYKLHNTYSFISEEVNSQYARSTDPILLSPLGDEMLRLLDGGTSSVMLSDAIVIWQDATDTHAGKGLDDVRRNVQLFTTLIGDKPLDQITNKNVLHYIEQRLRVVKTTSVARELSSLRAVWNQGAKRHEIAKINPFQATIKGMGKDTEDRPRASLEHTTTLLRKLESELTESYAGPLAAIVALTGMRNAEAWGLEEADWDKVNNVLYVRPNKTRPSLKTKNSERPFPVLPELAKWLDRYFKAEKANSANTASATTGKLYTRLDLPFTNHGLRHGMRDRLVECDGNGLQIDELLGWSDQGMIRHYGRNAVTDQKRALLRKVYSRLIPSKSKDTVIAIRA